MIWLYNFTAFLGPLLISDYIELKYKLDFLKSFVILYICIFVSQQFLIPIKGEFFTLSVLSALAVAAVISKGCAENIIERENRN